eukprot:SAG31_NODE_1810_length_7224_cov_1.969965_1_plen_392_part_00
MPVPAAPQDGLRDNSVGSVLWWPFDAPSSLGAVAALEAARLDVRFENLEDRLAALALASKMAKAGTPFATITDGADEEFTEAISALGVKVVVIDPRAPLTPGHSRFTAPSPLAAAHLAGRIAGAVLSITLPPMACQRPFSRPLGADMAGWSPPAPLSPASAVVMKGRHCRLEPLDVVAHCAPMHKALSADTTGALWTYTGIFELRGELTRAPSMDEVRRWLEVAVESSVCYAIVAATSAGSGTSAAIGTIAFEDVIPEKGQASTGFVMHTRALQGTIAATEAHFLALDHAFGVGYRRIEWSCDALNEGSRRAAARLGYHFEGVLRFNRQKDDGINKPLSGTAYFSILDYEWPAVRAAIATWLAPDNFDERGMQRRRLSDLTTELHREQPRL